MTELAVQNEPSAQPLAQRLQKPMADIGPALGLMAVVLVVWEFVIREQIDFAVQLDLL